MTITKHEHACFVAEHDGQKLVIDPGIYSKSLGTPKGVVAVILTHQHSDHVDPDKVKAILEANPGASLYGTTDTAAMYLDLPVTIMHSGETLHRDNFEVEFFGGKHAEIHPEVPRVENLGMLINGKVFYPGDSFTKPDVDKLAALLVPAAAPWLKVREAIDYVAAVRAAHVIPTHDAILSDEGKQTYDKWLQQATDSTGGKYKRLGAKESIKL